MSASMVLPRWQGLDKITVTLAGHKLTKEGEHTIWC